MGSGTIPVFAAMRKHEAIGFDLDPLAVIIARAWGRSLVSRTFMRSAKQVVRQARERDDEAFAHSDLETQEFIDYWFDRRTQLRLGALARAIADQPEDLRVPLWCAFSRLIKGSSRPGLEPGS
jgi:hypothetical protein